MIAASCAAENIGSMTVKCWLASSLAKPTCTCQLENGQEPQPCALRQQCSMSEGIRQLCPTTKMKPSSACSPPQGSLVSQQTTKRGCLQSLSCLWSSVCAAGQGTWARAQSGKCLVLDSRCDPPGAQQTPQGRAFLGLPCLGCRAGPAGGWQSQPGTASWASCPADRCCREVPTP